MELAHHDLFMEAVATLMTVTRRVMLPMNGSAENGFVVEIPVAGFKRGEIDVLLDRNVLSIAAKSERRKLA
jgi:HSP20 family molecular chaperone IbpA